MNWKKKKSPGDAVLSENARFGKDFLAEAGIPEAEAMAAAERALKALLSRKGLSACVGYPPPEHRYYSVESASGSGERKLVGVGLSRELAFLDALGHETQKDRTSPIELKILLDLE